jgi:Leucine-rich repeat (LRR) protein
MTASYLVLSLLLAQPQSIKTKPSQAQTAEAELRKCGAFFKEYPLYRQFIRKVDRDAEWTDDPSQSYVTIDGNWTGDREKLKYLRDLPNLLELDFVREDFTDDWCTELDHHPELEGLFFAEVPLTAKRMKHFGKLHNLQALALIGSQGMDEGLKYVRDKTKLRWLSLSMSDVTDEGLAHLKDLKNLQDLSLDTTITSGKGLTHLKGLTRLRRLRLSGLYGYPSPEKPWIPEGPSGLEHLAGMKEMRELSAAYSNVTDEDLAVVRNMPKLERLHLEFNPVTDKGLADLAGLTELKELTLSFTYIRGDGLRHLRKLPSLRRLDLAATDVDDKALSYQLSRICYHEGRPFWRSIPR